MAAENESTKLELNQTQGCTFELELNANDMLVIEVPKLLNEDLRARAYAWADAHLGTPGRKLILLEAGATCKVIHRPDMDKSTP